MKLDKNISSAMCISDAVLSFWVLKIYLSVGYFNYRENYIQHLLTPSKTAPDDEKILFGVANLHITTH